MKLPRYLLLLCLISSSLSISAMSAEQIRKDTDLVSKATVGTYMGMSVLGKAGIAAGSCTLGPVSATLVGGVLLTKFGYDFFSSRYNTVAEKTKETK